MLLQSAGFDSPRDAGQRIAAIRRDGLSPGDVLVNLGADSSIADVEAALAALAAAEENKS